MRERFDVHAEITKAIIAAIENGPGDFQLPWHRPGVCLERPKNAVTGHRYSGVNILALWASGMERGYESGLWASYRQWRELGGQVKKGEKGTVIVFCKELTVEVEDEMTGDATPETRLFARASRVFNAAQVDGFELAAPEVKDPARLLAAAEAFVAATGVVIDHCGSSACYIPARDIIQMPPRERFTGTDTSSATESYYSTVCHELTHWSGAPHRLDRELSGRFGSKSYAMEELVAELGSAFLCADLAISPAPRADHAAYLAGWLKVAKEDPRALFTVASKASQAASFLQGNGKVSCATSGESNIRQDVRLRRLRHGT